MSRYCCHCLHPVAGTEQTCPVCGKPVDDTVPFHHLPAGTMLKDRYYIGVALGQGGFGITYAACDTKTNGKVAVKEYYPNGFVNRNNTRSASVVSSTDPTDESVFTKGRQRFLEEASILAAFSGVDGIVNVQDCFRENNTVYIVMEFLDGVSLKQYLAHTGKLSVESALNLLLPVMNALREIHRKELIHRDISPDNIMLTRQNGSLRVKLIDFGAARHFSAVNSRSLTVVLKPGFAPIEQYGSKDEQGAWTDVYALCATIYKCVTGVAPESAPDRVRDDHLLPPSRLGVAIDANTERVLMKGLSVYANDRYQTVEEMLLDLLPGSEETPPAPESEPDEEKKPSGEESSGEEPSGEEPSGKESSGEEPGGSFHGKKKKRIAAVVSAAAVIAVAAALIVFLPKQKKTSASGRTVSTTPRVTTTVGQTESAAVAVPAEADPAADYVSQAFIDPVNDWSRYDDLITAIKTETDFAARANMMRQAEDILMSNYCVVPIYFYKDNYLQQDYLQGVYANQFAVKYFLYATLGNGSDTLRLNLASEPITLDPALIDYLDGACLAANSFVGLYTYDESGNIVPACAEDCTVSDGGLSYTVRLKQGLRWSDGSALTAADFVYAWKRAADPATKASYRNLFSVFAGYEDNDIQVTAPDDTTLTFVLTAPCPYMEDLMAFTTFCPVKKEAVEAADGWQNDPGAWCKEAGFVSNGAYVCTGWEHEVSMTYEKNPYFYQADRVSIARQEYMLSMDGSAITAAYLQGELDFSDSFSVYNEESNALLSSPQLHIVDLLGTAYMAFNAQSKLFEGKTPAQAACMREAVSLLFDRYEYCNKIGQNGSTAANAFIPAGMADGNGGVYRAEGEDGYFDAYAINKDHEGTVERARELLRAAGFSFGEDGMLSADTPLSIDFLVNKDNGNTALVVPLRKNMEEIGAVLNVRIEDQNTLIADQEAGDYDVVRGGWFADFNDPVNMLEMWITSSGSNACRFGRTD